LPKTGLYDESVHQEYPHMAQPTQRRPALTPSARLTGLALGVTLATLATAATAAPHAQQGKRLTRQALPGAHINWTLASAADTSPPGGPTAAPADGTAPPASAAIPAEAAGTDRVIEALVDAPAPTAPRDTSAAPLAPNGTPDTTTDTTEASVAPRATGSTLQQIGSSLRGLWATMQSRFRLAAVLTPPGSAATLASATEPSHEGSLIRIRSGLQTLPDYAVEGGFRATAGLVRAEGDNWWTTHNDRYSSNSYQRLNASGVLSASNLITSETSYRTVRPYLGAGYSSRLVYKGSPSLWRFNADLGLLSVSDPSATRLSQAIQPERTVDDVLRDIRLRPTVKVSLGYSF
jgi:hypothetical protein